MLKHTAERWGKEMNMENVENVVYITGAGFSRPLGLPLMFDFIEKARDLYNSNKAEYKSFKDIFDSIHGLSYIKNFYETDLDNIEEVLSILTMAEFTGETTFISSFQKFIKKVIADLLLIIRERRKVSVARIGL
jgi:NAD-dependent SIR2 family protein deacetylase